jgi:LacI family transcriptional regulator
MPVLLLERDIALEHDRVQQDHAAGLQAVVLHLAALGHRHLALVVDGAEARLLAVRIVGFRSGLHAAGLRPDAALIVELADGTGGASGAVGGVPGGAARAVSLLLQREPRPTALAVPGSQALAEVLHAIALSGLRIPRDVSLVSLGDPPLARGHAPPLTALDVDSEQMAEQVVSMLLERVLRHESGPARVVNLLPRLIERGSCAPPPGAEPQVRSEAVRPG